MMRPIHRPELQNIRTQRRRATSSWAASAKLSLLFRTFTATCFFLLGNKSQLPADVCQRVPNQQHLPFSQPPGPGLPREVLPSCQPPCTPGPRASLLVMLPASGSTAAPGTSKGLERKRQSRDNAGSKREEQMQSESRSHLIYVLWFPGTGSACRT